MNDPKLSRDSILNRLGMPCRPVPSTVGLIGEDRQRCNILAPTFQGPSSGEKARGAQRFAHSPFRVLPFFKVDENIKWGRKWTIMSLLAFPGRLDTIRESVALASIYPSHWSFVLSSFERLLPGTTTSIDRVFVGSSEVVFLSTPNDPSLSDLEGVSGPSTLVVDPQQYPVGTIFDLKDWTLAVCASGKVRCLSAHDQGEALSGTGLVLTWTGSWVWVITIQLPGDLAGHHNPGIAARLRPLALELCDAFAVCHGLGTPSEPGRETIESSWDQLSVGVALIESRLRLSAMNMAAQDILTMRRYFAPAASRSRLRAASVEDNEKMLHAADCIVSGHSEREYFALDGLRRTDPLPVVFQAVGRNSALQHLRAATPHPVDSFVAILGSGNTDDAISERIFA